MIHILSLLPGPCSPGPLAQLQSRQREYKLAALHAKQQGDTVTAARHFRVAKVRPGRRMGSEGEDRMLSTLHGCKEQGLCSHTGPDLGPGCRSLWSCSFLYLLKPQFTLSMKWA